MPLLVAGVGTPSLQLLQLLTCRLSAKKAHEGKHDVYTFHSTFRLNLRNAAHIGVLRELG